MADRYTIKHKYLIEISVDKLSGNRKPILGYFIYFLIHVAEVRKVKRVKKNAYLIHAYTYELKNNIKGMQTCT